MANYYYSNCSTITVGCYLYTNTGLTTPVSNGYYSDGTNCFTVTGGSGYVSSVDTCAEFITIDTYTPTSMTCQTSYTFTAATFGNVNVNVNVNVEITWVGDLAGSVSGTVSLPSSTSCNSTSVNSSNTINCNGENLSYVSVILDPSGGGGQIFQVGDNYNAAIAPC